MHGTPAGYAWHMRHEILVCPACREAYRERRRQIARAARQARGVAPHQLRPCGTESAYQRHVRRQEFIDEDCRRAHTQHCRDYRTALRRRQQEQQDGGAV